MKKKQWRPFEEARKFARSLKLKNQGEWNEYSKSDERPFDIPSNPNDVYEKDGWKSLGDWLGTGRTRVPASNRASFEKAREFARSLKLKSGQEWKNTYLKSGEKPDDIPAKVYDAYKNKGWKGWDDFLGVKKIRKYTKDNTRPFKEAREFVRSLKLKNLMDWKNYVKSGKKPDDIPGLFVAMKIYKGWINLGDWLGTGTIAERDREYRSFNEAREFARKLGLKSRAEWEEYCKSGEKPDDIPTMITQTYKKEFTTMGDFLGTGTIAGQTKAENYLTFNEAEKEYKKLAKQYGLTNREEFMKFFRKNPSKLPKNLPLAPWMYYTKAKVWRKMR